MLLSSRSRSELREGSAQDSCDLIDRIGGDCHVRCPNCGIEGSQGWSSIHRPGKMFDRGEIHQHHDRGLPAIPIDLDLRRLDVVVIKIYYRLFRPRHTIESAVGDDKRTAVIKNTGLVAVQLVNRLMEEGKIMLGKFVLYELAWYCCICDLSVDS